MINKNDINQIVKNILKREQGIPDRRLMHPKREWAIGLLVCLLVVLSGGIYSFIIFNIYSNIKIEDVEANVSVLNYKRADALKAIDVFQKRSDDHDLIISTRPVVIDEVVIETDSNDTQETEGEIDSGAVINDEETPEASETIELE